MEPGYIRIHLLNEHGSAPLAWSYKLSRPPSSFNLVLRDNEEESVTILSNVQHIVSCFKLVKFLSSASLHQAVPDRALSITGVEVQPKARTLWVLLADRRTVEGAIRMK